MNNISLSRRVISKTVAASFLLVITLLGFPLPISSEASSADRSSVTKWSEAISVTAERRGNPWINVENGREIVADFTGAGRSVSVATADFDEDGMPDLVIGHAAGLSGTVTVMRGNVDAVYPNTAEARERVLKGVFTSVPFLGSAQVAGLPLVPNFLVAGDFDADGHFDIAAASRNGNAVIFMRGDGQGGFRFARKVKLPGNVTALLADDFNRRDGLNDLIVGVATNQGGQVFAFEHPHGAMNALPETFDFAAPVTSLAINFIEGDARPDLVIGAGNELAILRGRDRRLMLGESGNSAEVVHFTRKTFNFQIKALAAGEFIKSETYRTEIALLASDGQVHIFENGGIEDANGVLSADWREQRTVSLPAGLLGSDLPVMLTARVSARSVDTLVVGLGEQIHLLTSDVAPPRGERERIHFGAQKFGLAASLDVASGTVAILPMRLNVDALSDLVVMREGSVAPTMVLTTPMATFTVVSTANVDDGNLSNGTCETPPCNPKTGVCTGPCTYLAARQQANFNGGSSTINFDVAGPFLAPQVGILNPLTIDGTTAPGGLVEFVGMSNQFPATHVTGSQTDNCVFRGMVANGFDGNNHYINLQSSHHIVEGNRIGTNIAGTAVPGPSNGNGGVAVGGQNNVVGGTTSAARNLISTGDTTGLNVSGNANLVQGNFIGTDITGTVGLGNRYAGVIIQGPNTVLGGTMPGARNIISATTGDANFGASGVNTVGGMGILVQGNYIGTNASGTAALGNMRFGIYQTSNGTGFDTIGGTNPAARNIISGNVLDGLNIGLTGNAMPQILGNYIGTNPAGDSAIPNGGFGLRFSALLQKVISNNLISGNSSGGLQIQKANNSAPNDVISDNLIGTDATGTNPIGNNGIGLILGSGIGNGGTTGQTITGNTIAANTSHAVLVDGGFGLILQDNFIGTNASFVANLGNGGDGMRFINQQFGSNQVGGAGAGNTIAFNAGVGINMLSTSVNFSSGNRFASNAIFSNGVLGIDLGGDGITMNDPGDQDGGPNRLQNFPVIESVTAAGVITGTIDSAVGNSNYPIRVEFFANTACDPTGYGEGRTFLGFVSLAAPGGFSHTVTLVPGQSCITATATDDDGNTSEFSLGSIVGGGTPTPTPTPTPSSAQQLNISTRMRVQAGDNVLIGGFIVTGSAPKSVAVRGIGPSLAQLGIPDLLVDPTLELRASNGALLAQNDDWQDDPASAAQLSALGLGLQHPAESGLVATLQPNAYTAILAGALNGTGVGLVEIYDTSAASGSELANISTRGFVLTGDNVMIGGFILGGGGNTHVAIRGIGPSLSSVGISPVLMDPTLELHDGNGALLVSNDNWQDDPASASQLSALGLAPTNPAESGIYTLLPPGAFTAILAGAGSGTGIGLVEIYNVH